MIWDVIKKIILKNIYLFINKYFVIFKVTPLRYNTPNTSVFFQSSKHFWNELSGIANSFCFEFSFISLSQNPFFSSVSLVLGGGKSQRGPSPVNTVAAAWLRFCFLPKTHAQASMRELVCYHGAKSMIGFSTILWVSN